jgi:uroporphyrinogen decarboxylase
LELPSGGPIHSHEDLYSYEPPDPNKPYRCDSVKQAAERFKGKRAIAFCAHEAFEFSHYLYGMTNLLIDYIEDPKFVHDLVKTVSDYKLEIADAAIDAGADVIVSGDDYASRTAPLMSPRQFEEFCLPYLQKLVDRCKRRGVPHIKHTDGNIWPIIDMIVDTGTSALDPLEPVAGMDIGVVKEKYGDRVAVVGNVDCTGVLPLGDEHDVIEAVKETIAKASPGGGHILASSNSIHPAVKPENYRTMVRTAREFGKYPLDKDMVEEYRKKKLHQEIYGLHVERTVS